MAADLVHVRCPLSLPPSSRAPGWVVIEGIVHDGEPYRRINGHVDHKVFVHSLREWASFPDFTSSTPSALSTHTTLGTVFYCCDIMVTCGLTQLIMACQPLCLALCLNILGSPRATYCTHCSFCFIGKQFQLMRNTQPHPQVSPGFNHGFGFTSGL